MGGCMEGALNVSVIPQLDGRWVEQHPEGYLLCAMVVRDGTLVVRREHLAWVDVDTRAVGAA